MVQYWLLVLRRAGLAARKWLIGDLWRGVIQLALFIGATVILARTGEAAQAKEQLRWAAAVLEAAALIFVPMFGFYLLRAPADIDREKSEEISSLREKVGRPNAQTFAIEIEAISPNDGDRSYLGDENLVRAKITNMDPETPFQAYACLEDIVPPTGGSPAAKLAPMGKPSGDGNVFSIAPSESVYVLVLERDGGLNPFAKEDDCRTFVRFSPLSSSSNAATAGAALALRNEETDLAYETEYTATLTVHATGAKSARLRFSVCVHMDGRLDLSTYS